MGHQQQPKQEAAQNPAAAHFQNESPALQKSQNPVLFCSAAPGTGNELCIQPRGSGEGGGGTPLARRVVVVVVGPHRSAPLLSPREPAVSPVRFPPHFPCCVSPRVTPWKPKQRGNTFSHLQFCASSTPS